MTQDAHSMNRFKKLRVMNLFLIQLGWKLHWFRTLHFAITKQSPMSLIRAGSKLCRTVGLQELGWRPLHKVSQPQFNTEPTCYITNWNKNEITDLSRLGQDSDAFIASKARHQHNQDLLHGALENEARFSIWSSLSVSPLARLQVAWLRKGVGRL